MAAEIVRTTATSRQKAHRNESRNNIPARTPATASFHQPEAVQRASEGRTFGYVVPNSGASAVWSRGPFPSGMMAHTFSCFPQNCSSAGSEKPRRTSWITTDISLRLRRSFQQMKTRTSSTLIPTLPLVLSEEPPSQRSGCPAEGAGPRCRFWSRGR